MRTLFGSVLSNSLSLAPTARHLLLGVCVSTVAILSGCGVGAVEGDSDAGGPGSGGGDADGGSGGGLYHPAGFAASTMHGPEFNLQQQDCRSCHGDDLTGAAAAPSCDTCHTPRAPQAWRSDCTFCHGGVESATGAPPGELTGSPQDQAFGAHSAHLGSLMMAAMDCTDCHAKPGDVLTAGHAFDDTPGAAEVLFANGRSPDGAYAAAVCSNLYCHGTGLQTGAVAATAGAMTCGGCHGEPPASGEHREHRGNNCFECHNDTTKDDVTIANVALHIDGMKQVAIENPGGLTVTRVGAEVRCSGQCHGQGRNHQNDRW